MVPIALLVTNPDSPSGGATTVVHEIDGMWQDEGFAPGPTSENLDGVRRALFQFYRDVVDWTDDAHVARALRVFETVVRGRDPALSWVRG